MSEGMLGNLLLADVQGVRDDLERKLAGPQGQTWFRALKRMLRRENPWNLPAYINIVTDGRKRPVHELGIDEKAQAALIRVQPDVTAGRHFRLVFLAGDEFSATERLGSMLALGRCRGYQLPPPEVVLYLPDHFTAESMALAEIKRLVVMHHWNAIDREHPREEQLAFGPEGIEFCGPGYGPKDVFVFLDEG